MKIVNNGLTIVVGGALGHFPKEFVSTALEKQTRKEPKYIDGDYDLPLCPSCGLSVDEDRDKYCSICGQALDWSDTE